MKCRQDTSFPFTEQLSPLQTRNPIAIRNRKNHISAGMIVDELDNPVINLSVREEITGGVLIKNRETGANLSDFLTLENHNSVHLLQLTIN